MSGKNQFPVTINWQSTNPQTNFLPANYQSGSPSSGVVSGTMSSTNTIYSQIIDVSKMDNLGFEVNWSGTPTGTLTVSVSNSGINWPNLTFSPVLAQPSGSAGFYALGLELFEFKYVMFSYTNVSGSGTLTIYGQNKDMN